MWHLSDNQNCPSVQERRHSSPTLISLQPKARRCGTLLSSPKKEKLFSFILPPEHRWEERKWRQRSHKNFPSDSHQWGHESPQQSQGHKEWGGNERRWRWGGGAQGTFLQHPVWVCFRKRPPVAKHHKSRTIAHREESREGFRSKWHWGQSLSTSIQLVMPAKLSQCYESPEKTVAPTLFYQSSANKKRSHELLTHNNDKEDDNISYACYESEDPHSRSYSVVS